MRIVDMVPAEEHRPALLYTMPETNFPPTLNLVDWMIDRHVEDGRGDRPALFFHPADGRPKATSRTGSSRPASGPWPPASSGSVLAPYKYSRVVEFIDVLPMDAAGKIPYGELRKREQELRGGG